MEWHISTMSFGPYLYGNSLLKKKLMKHIYYTFNLCFERTITVWRGKGVLHHSFQSLVTAQGITTSFYQWKKNSRTHFILLSKYCRKRILRCTCTPVYHRFFFEITLDIYKQLAHFGIGSKHLKSRQNHIVPILKTQTQKYSGYCQ